MDRTEFIKTCGFAYLGASTLGVFLQGCVGSKMITSPIVGENIIVPLTEFYIIKNNEKTYRRYVVVQNAQLQFPICVYRLSENEYTALYLTCTHQGNELTVYGDRMVCSAHGSEFDNKGNVVNSPADKPLKSFPVIIENQNLNISLKA